MIALLLASALYTNTAQVQSVAVAGGVLWAATGGGVEKYAFPSGERIRVYTSDDGLTSNDVRAVTVQDGVLHARTQNGDCALRAGRFDCAAAASRPPPLRAAESFRGARVTDRLRARGHEVIATVDGLYIGGRRITPAGQICGNHIAALATFRGHLWAGAFDGGLCTLEEGRWRTPATPFRMVNALHATNGVLYVAAAEGLFSSRDGRRFRREPRIRERGVNGIAASQSWLFVTTPVALYAFRNGSSLMKRFRMPAGSTALQAVAVSGDNVWLASEDMGVIRMRAETFAIFDMASGLPSSWMVDVAPAPNGGVWAATLRDGLVHLDRDGRLLESRAQKTWGLRVYVDAGRVLFGTQQGLDGAQAALPDSHVHAILRDDGALFVGTEGGLFASAR